MQKNKTNLNYLRHSCAHLLAAAVTKLWPNAKPTIGPSIEDGFYYDFDNLKISDDDLPKIEKEMLKIVKSWSKFEKIPVSSDEARTQFKNNEYKKELISEFEKEGQEITLYKSGDFIDLCRGGHSNNPSLDLKNFKLLSIAGAYWRGDEKNKMLTRIYGTAFPSKGDLTKHLEQLELAIERDHRKIGKELDLFIFSDLVGKGLPLLTPKGTTIRRELERFIINEEIKRGYQHVKTPDLAKVALYEKSGHYPYYKNTMYPVMQVDEEKLILRPMTCPHHFQLFSSRPRSYRELPMRIAELAHQYRYEKSGELTGLMRVRLFTLADAHIICRKKQAESEIDGVLELIDFISQTFGLKRGKDYRYRLSKGDRNDSKKFYKDDKAWDFAENVLRKALKKSNAPFYEEDGEAAFYGPKIDVQIKNVINKEDTAFTVQYDFVMPKRFSLKYNDETGKLLEPVVIHRSSIGALERVMAFLIEHFAGAFPVWLHPVQVKILPITEKNVEYANEVMKKLKNEEVRAELDDRNETLQAKIRDAQLEKVPYMLIVGDKEEKAENVAVRLRTEEDLGQMDLIKFTQRVKDKVENKALDL